MRPPTEAHPLQWPVGWPRTDYPVYSQFKSPTVASARNLVLHELSRLGASDVVISSNMIVNRDGYPSARQPRLADTGVAVYFKMDGEERCIPSDKYVTVEENLHAVGRTIEALRSLERWGTGQIMKAAFRGFAALPETIIAGPGNRAWWEVLGVPSDASPHVIVGAYKELRKKLHPDVGGSHHEFLELQEAFKQSGAEK